MKPVLAWVKANLLIVIFSFLIVVTLPVCWFFSTGWSKRVIEDREKSVKGDFDKLKVNVTYTVPTIGTDQPAMTYTGAPNEVATQWFAQKRAEINEQADEVAKRALEFNSGGRKPLIDGLFPDATGAMAQSRSWALARTFSGADGVSVYAKLFEEINAGGPTPGNELAAQIQDVFDREKAALVGDAATPRSLTKEEEDKITQSLVERRKGLLQQRARRLSVFGGVETVSGQIPTGVPREPPPNAQCFEWQVDYWHLQDVLGFIRTANTDSSGQQTSVPDSVIKRIEKITLNRSPMAFRQAGEGAAGDGAAAGGEVGTIAPDFTKSPSGRWGGAGNGVYDVLTARVQLIVSSRRLPEIFDAVVKSNFMAITDLDLSEVDIWQELEQGYFYGDESVIRVSLDLQTVWLRSWTTPFMPKAVRAQLGIPDPPAPEGASPAEGTKTGG